MYSADLPDTENIVRIMQCLPRIALSPSTVAVQQLRSFKLLPSLLSEASNGSGASAETRRSSDIKLSYDMVIAGDGPVSTALACSIGKEKKGQTTRYWASPPDSIIFSPHAIVEHVEAGNR